jgi:hypothetical protein
LALAELNLKSVWECCVTMSAVLFMEVMDDTQKHLD